MNGSDRMELKYCECCGGLLLRGVGSEAVYCARCREQLETLAPRRRAAADAPSAGKRRPITPTRVYNIEAGTWSAALLLSHLECMAEICGGMLA